MALAASSSMLGGRAPVVDSVITTSLSCLKADVAQVDLITNDVLQEKMISQANKYYHQPAVPKLCSGV